MLGRALVFLAVVVTSVFATMLVGVSYSGSDKMLVAIDVSGETLHTTTLDDEEMSTVFSSALSSKRKEYYLFTAGRTLQATVLSLGQWVTSKMTFRHQSQASTYGWSFDPKGAVFYGLVPGFSDISGDGDFVVSFNPNSGEMKGLYQFTAISDYDLVATVGAFNYTSGQYALIMKDSTGKSILHNVDVNSKKVVSHFDLGSELDFLRISYYDSIRDKYSVIARNASSLSSGVYDLDPTTGSLKAVAPFPSEYELTLSQAVSIDTYRGIAYAAMFNPASTKFFLVGIRLSDGKKVSDVALEKGALDHMQLL